MSGEYEQCDECGAWCVVSGPLANYVEVQTAQGKRIFLHSNPCQNKWFDSNCGSIIEEVRHGKKLDVIRD